MRELQNSQAAPGSATDSGEVERLKDQVRQFSDRQNFLEAQQFTSGQLEAQLSTKIRELEAHIEQPPTALANHEVSALRAEMAGLVERIADAEAAAAREPIPVDSRPAQEQIAMVVREQTETLKAQLFEQLQRQTSVDSEFTALETSFQHKLDGLQQDVREKAALMAGLAERLVQAEAAATRADAGVDSRLDQEQIIAIVREQTEALKTQLFEQRQRQTAVDSEFKALESSFQSKLDGLQQEIREKAALLRLRDGELGDLRMQLAGVAQRLDQVAVAPPPEASASERETERLLWQRDFDERLTTRLRELGDEIRGKLHGVTSAKVDQEQFRGEILALTARIAELEQSNHNTSAGAATEAREAHQVTVALRGEIAALKTALLEQQRAQPNDALVRSVEAMLRGQIHEVHNQLAQNQRGTLESENQFKELRGDIQTLAQRQIQAETLAKQTHALVTQETAQIRGALKADLVAIEAQLHEQRSRDATLQVMEDTLNVRMRELHNQLAQGMLALDQRDGDFRELKTQVQILAQQAGQNGSPPPLVSLSRPEPLGGFTPSLRAAELRPTVTAERLDSVPNLLQPAVPDNGQTPDSGKAPVIDLHDRLSAEIERKRAELREKSGRWKVRQ